MRVTDKLIFKKIVVFPAVILMVLTLCLAAFFIAAEAHHHCEGEECHICDCIRQCEAVLYRTKGTVALVPAIVISVALFLFSAELKGADLLQTTPVSEKVRINR